MKATNETYERILSSLYGQAYADAFGMPSELWTRKQVQDFFGTIKTFLPGPKENIAAVGFEAGQFTDDTSQALALTDSFIQTQGIVDSTFVAKHIMKWAIKINAFEKNILGPSSKEALTKINNNVPVAELENLGVTNGAAMRIAPVGMLTPTDDTQLFEKQVYNACACTHKSDVAIAGAGAVAYIISKQISGDSWQNCLQDTIAYSKNLQYKYHNTFSPFIYARIEQAIEIAEKYLSEIKTSNTQNSDTADSNIFLNEIDQQFSEAIYEYIGTDMQTYNSVPAAFGVAHYCAMQNNPVKVAHICANIGGDTDTIGAISMAMVAAGYTCDIYSKEDLQLISKVNQVDFEQYASQIFDLRQSL